MNSRKRSQTDRSTEEYRREVTVDGVTSQLEVLDTAGAEQFTALNEVYIKVRRMATLTQDASLREVDNLREQIYRIKGGRANIPIVIVGTKSDLVNEREVQLSTISNLSQRWGLPFFETSAKKNWHVAEVFDDLVRQMRKCYPEEKTRVKRRHLRCLIM
ncbi:hypothetical protein HWV62_44663 [Athelia sp. TMB]|nr:hypothetical protein HWV62_44663 [Athelia sp. TMB]